MKKQETLEETAENESEYLADYEDKEAYQKAFIEGAKYQSERSYSEEEIGELVYAIIGQYANKVNIMIDGSIIDRLFEQFKKKA
jgi:hypothetical protein